MEPQATNNTTPDTLPPANSNPNTSPQIVVNSTEQPAQQAQPIAQQPNPFAATPPDASIVVGSQLPDDYKPQRNRKKLIKKIVIALIIVGVILAGLVFASGMLSSKLKTVIYDNGSGARFQLKFYSRHTTKNIGSTTGSTGLTELVSKVSVASKAPLTVWLQTNESNAASFTNDDCTHNNLKKSFDTRIDYLNKNVAVCTLGSQDIGAAELSGTEIIYIVTFHDSKNGYLAFISQDVDFKKLSSSPAKAKEGLATLGLASYRDDIKTILASVKPIN